MESDTKTAIDLVSEQSGAWYMWDPSHHMSVSAFRKALVELHNCVKKEDAGLIDRGSAMALVDKLSYEQQLCSTPKTVRGSYILDALRRLSELVADEHEQRLSTGANT